MDTSFLNPSGKKRQRNTTHKPVHNRNQLFLIKLIYLLDFFNIFYKILFLFMI